MVSGSETEPYNVMMDLAHPRHSECNCPFANWHKVCKHMVEVFFAAFPEDTSQYMEEIRHTIREEELYREKLPARIEKYLNNLTKAELKDLALSLIYELMEYEFDCFVRDYIDNVSFRKTYGVL